MYSDRDKIPLSDTIVRLGDDLCCYCLHTCILVHIFIKIFQVAFHGLEFYLTGTNPMQLHFLRFRGRNWREWVSKPDPSVYFIFQSYFYTRPGSNYRILGPFLFHLVHNPIDEIHCCTYYSINCSLAGQNHIVWGNMAYEHCFIYVI